jgi:S-formylglutathione hydrolase FrmB
MDFPVVVQFENCHPSAAKAALACGSADDFLAVNREFVAQLSAQADPYEYHETAGGHAWDYWDRSVKGLLRAVADLISR